MVFSDLLGFIGGSSLAIIALIFFIVAVIATLIPGAQLFTFPTIIVAGILFLIGSLIGFSSFFSIFSSLFGGNLTTVLIAVGAIVLFVFVLKTVFTRR